MLPGLWLEITDAVAVELFKTKALFPCIMILWLWVKTHVDLLFPHSEINKGVDTNLGVDPKTLKYLIYLFPNENYFRYKKQNKNKNK